MRMSKPDLNLQLIGRLLVALVGVTVGSQLALAEPRSATTDERIKHVESALLSPIQLDGKPSKTKSLIERMAELHVPGVSIAVVHEGELEWARGFGVAELAGSPVTPRTLFQAASISKPITALAVMSLVQDGKLNLDADVNGYLKDWKLPTNKFTEQHAVTLRGLLTHSAGVTVHGFPGYESGEYTPTLIQILDGVKPANTDPIRVDMTPGTKMRYSGGGYVIIQQLLEDVTRQPFPKLMSETVLLPLGMTDSTFEQPLPAGRIKEIATPYRANGKPVKGGPHTYPERAPAGLWTTPTDLARYIVEVQRMLAGKSSGVLTPEMARAMLTPTLNDQALGPRVGENSKRKFFVHNGSNEGYRCVFFAYEDGAGVVIMTNGDNGSKLFSQILNAIAVEYGWPKFQ
jgi:CubicO group peptidase (beta-lactamase class C family)